MLTIETWLNALGREQRIEDCPLWPPDLYAISGALLKRSGAYLRIFEREPASTYLKNVETMGRAWRGRIDALKHPNLASLRRARPPEMRRAWTQVIASGGTRISDIRESRPLTEQLIQMALVADEASAGLGVTWDPDSPYLTLAGQILWANDVRSFCWDVPNDVVCVLGKQHTPQRGATFRSLSHHLSLYLPNDIEGRWFGPFPLDQAADDDRNMLNLLLLPWPASIDTADFTEVSPGTKPHERSSRASYFRFRPTQDATPAKFSRALKHAIAAAQLHAGRIDAIVFPELALNADQYEVAERVAVDAGTTLVSGVRRALRGQHQDLNLCVLQPAGTLRAAAGGHRKRQQLVSSLRLNQSKHHRWCLDREQIVNYQLGGRLPVSRSCWENIQIPPRVLNFVTLSHWMTWSVLICEDLARQDPAADLIRAVGPNLVIALLMDGPQLSGRWPSRYASVLAEDPGCSVLTLTNLGMAQRCRPVLRTTGKRADASRVIGLWRDVEAGEIEIALDAGDDACVLSLECRLREEYSADGRSDGGETRYPVFAGFRSFRSEP
jgi:hypothetical protein